MPGPARVAGVSAIVFGLAGLAWFVLESTPPRLGFEDTDDPALMVRFITAHPEVYAQAGLAMLLMAVALVITAMAVTDAMRTRADALALRTTAAFALIGATLFLAGGAVKIGSSGPLLHMAGLRPEWGETAYVAAQVGSQAVMIGGILALCLWAVGLSLIGARSRVLPPALCLLGVLPALRILLGVLGVLGLAPGGVWIVWMLSIPGTIVWGLLLGVVLLRRGSALADEAAAPGPLAADASPG